MSGDSPGVSGGRAAVVTAATRGPHGSTSTTPATRSGARPTSPSAGREPREWATTTSGSSRSTASSSATRSVTWSSVVRRPLVADRWHRPPRGRSRRHGGPRPRSPWPSAASTPRSGPAPRSGRPWVHRAPARPNRRDESARPPMSICSSEVTTWRQAADDGGPGLLGRVRLFSRPHRTHHEERARHDRRDEERDAVPPCASRSSASWPSAIRHVPCSPDSLDELGRLQPLELEYVALGDEVVELGAEVGQLLVVVGVLEELGVELGLAGRRGAGAACRSGPWPCGPPAPRRPRPSPSARAPARSRRRTAFADAGQRPRARRSRYSSTPRGSIEIWPSPSRAQVESVTRSRK